MWQREAMTKLLKKSQTPLLKTQSGTAPTKTPIFRSLVTPRPKLSKITDGVYMMLGVCWEPQISSPQQTMIAGTSTTTKVSWRAHLVNSSLKWEKYLRVIILGSFTPIRGWWISRLKNWQELKNLFPDFKLLKKRKDARLNKNSSGTMITSGSKGSSTTLQMNARKPSPASNSAWLI